MDEKGIQRINELAHKAKAEGLTPAEKAEQKKLRQKFLLCRKSEIALHDDLDKIVRKANHTEQHRTAEQNQNFKISFCR